MHVWFSVNFDYDIQWRFIQTKGTSAVTNSFFYETVINLKKKLEYKQPKVFFYDSPKFMIHLTLIFSLRVLTKYSFDFYLQIMNINHV